MTKTSLNRSLRAAKASKKDEFYTQLSDIEKELKHYTTHFRGKSVLCNCDDPRISNFFTYFVNNFEKLGLERLITTCYQNDKPDLFSQHKSDKGIYFEYSGEQKKQRLPDPAKVKPRNLKGDGDFRSEECINLLKEADIVVTNPPFSLFREYVEQLMKYKKKFLIIGNYNAITYKEIFALLRANKIWLGYSHPVAFIVPDHYEMREVRSWRDEDGTNWRSFGNACWFTNLDIAKRHDPIILYKEYHRKDYPTYDNYDAIEVSKFADIPSDYDGVMGVPITFLERYNPEQFDILGITDRGNAWGLKTKEYTYNDVPNPGDLNRRAVIRIGNTHKATYARLLIRKKTWKSNSKKSQ
jgi:hypothetical protein